MSLLVLIAFVWLVPKNVQAICRGGGYDYSVANLREKLSNIDGQASAGADIYPGAAAAAIYLYTHQTEYAATAKVAINEYFHILQQAFLQGLIATTTPPTDALGANRFQVYNYNSLLPEPWPTHVKGVMDALPSVVKLLNVPTYVILIPESTGGIGSILDVDAAISHLVGLLWPNNCAGVQFNNTWHKLENNMIAEGEAEYYAASVYMAPGANSYNDANLAWNGQSYWNNRVDENNAMMSGTPGNHTYFLQLYFTSTPRHEQWLENLECTFGWTPNPVGEISMHWLQTHWSKRPTTLTHQTWMTLWIAAYTANSFPQAFQSVFGHSWPQFVCDLENWYGIWRAVYSCAGTETSPNVCASAALAPYTFPSDTPALSSPPSTTPVPLPPPLPPPSSSGPSIGVVILLCVLAAVLIGANVVAAVVSAQRYNPKYVRPM